MARSALVALALLLVSCGPEVLCDRAGRVGPRGAYMMYRCDDGTLLLVPAGPIPEPANRGVPT